MGIVKNRKPKFHRQLSHHFKRIGKLGWRRPRGKDSKQKRKEKSRGPRVEIGYRQPLSIRYLHPSGFKDMLVFNINDILGLDSKVHAVRIAGPVGKKKRAGIIKKCEEMKLKILNK